MKIVALIFIIIWVFLLAVREKINLKVYFGAFGILRTKIGLNVIDKLGKYKFWRKIGYISIPICVLLGGYALFNIINMSIKLISGELPKSAGKPIIFLFGSVIPILPGIIALTIAITAHELFHGVIARSFNINVKSSGILLMLGFPLGFFVELDEKFKTTEKKVRAAIASAGPMANLILCVISLPLMYLSYSIPSEIVVIKTYEPASKYLKSGDIILRINDYNIKSIADFKNFAKEIKPNKVYRIEVLRGNKVISYNIKSSNEGKLGLLVSPSGSLAFLINTLYWSYLFNLLLALFNLLPAFPLDGFYVFSSIPEIFKSIRLYKFGNFLEVIVNEKTLRSISLLIWWIILGAIIYSMW
ncbi:peptidase M50 [Methanocaldococcus villosus KIN24-T80]|uniref:Peptidase M50 n=1 Tax=Methanocaldococcus villosus KIN24-T80 TaxID=1069083 RepID=N6V116_9EURY|nr:site-2 protease family protein [Methanocaldococcus villosus]ENN95988.1 peptidase M50 [Methanocaldococcus villosus KIN24-T80]